MSITILNSSAFHIFASVACDMRYGQTTKVGGIFGMQMAKAGLNYQQDYHFDKVNKIGDTIVERHSFLDFPLPAQSEMAYVTMRVAAKHASKPNAPFCTSYPVKKKKGIIITSRCHIRNRKKGWVDDMGVDHTPKPEEKEKKKLPWEAEMGVDREQDFEFKGEEGEDFMSMMDESQMSMMSESQMSMMSESQMSMSYEDQMSMRDENQMSICDYS